MCQNIENLLSIKLLINIVLKRKKIKFSDLGLEIYIDEMPTSKESILDVVKGQRFSIVIVRSGSLSIQINNIEIYLSLNDLIVIPVRTTYEILNMSDQLQISVVSFSSEFILENSIRRPAIGYFDFFIIKAPMKVELKNREAVLLINSFKLLDRKRRSSEEHIFKSEIVLFSFNLLLYELAAIYSSYSWCFKVCHTRQEKLALEFLRILEINCKKQHSVKFYADTLKVSRGHLTRTVKAVTEKTVKQLIEEAIILEAKILLQNNGLTVLDIIALLKFGNTSVFSVFFKKYTAMSPTEYRLRLNIC
jgi:AraC family transcriptional activator of pobA